MAKRQTTFYNWCKENDKEMFLEMWDYDLNDVGPKDVTKGLQKKFYFKCPKSIHKSRLISLHNVQPHSKYFCRECYEYSFEDWCKDNNHIEYLDLWDYELNRINPNELRYNDYYHPVYFKCKNGKHDSYQKRLNNLINSKDCLCPICNSFYQWCVDNDRMDYINAWADERDIKNIPKHSGIKCKFLINGIEYKYAISDITCNNKKDGKTNPIDKYYNSFGYYLLSNFGNDGIEKYWSDKNNISPFYVDRASSKKYWLKCVRTDYHPDYQSPPMSFINGCRCVYCASKKIHYRDSFGYKCTELYGDDWIDKYWCADNNVDPFTLPTFYNGKVHIKCMKIEYHDYNIIASGYIMGRNKENIGPCPYCKRKLLHPNDSLAGQMPDIVNVWSEKNNKTPYEYAFKTHKKVWLKCEENKHEDYYIKVSDYTHKNIRCPLCSKEKTISSYQEKTEQYLLDLGYTLLHEQYCSLHPKNTITNYTLRYDNEIPELKMVIEVHGRQHYQIDGFHYSTAKVKGITPEEQFEYEQWKDKLKKDYAINKGYAYLELPYYLFDEKDTYKKVLQLAIKRRKATLSRLWEQYQKEKLKTS